MIHSQNERQRSPCRLKTLRLWQILCLYNMNWCCALRWVYSVDGRICFMACPHIVHALHSVYEQQEQASERCAVRVRYQTFKFTNRRARVHSFTRGPGWITLLWRFFLCVLFIKMLRSQRVLWEEEGSQHIKYQRMWTRALVGEFIHGRWRMAASQTTSLVPGAVSVAYWSASSWTVPFSKSLPGSIFITAPVWMSNSISAAHRQITCLDPEC